MIKFENLEVMNFRNALRGMRNPLNSWDKNDSIYCGDCVACVGCPYENLPIEVCEQINRGDLVKIGDNDYNLCRRLIKAGTEHSKFLRQIFVSVDITAPLYWWKEFDTYKIGTVANSCSTMHKLTYKEFEKNDFSFEDANGELADVVSWDLVESIIDGLNILREKYLNCNDEKMKYNYWRSMIQLLPSSYNQKRTVSLNYEVIKSIYKQRKGHKLVEWREFYNYFEEKLPYSEFITLKFKK